MSNPEDDPVLRLLAATLRIEQYAKRLVELSEALYERAITIAVSSAETAHRARYTPGSVPLVTSEEEKPEWLREKESE